MLGAYFLGYPYLGQSGYTSSVGIYFIAAAVSGDSDVVFTAYAVKLMAAIASGDSDAVMNVVAGFNLAILGEDVNGVYQPRQYAEGEYTPTTIDETGSWTGL